MHANYDWLIKFSMSWLVKIKTIYSMVEISDGWSIYNSLMYRGKRDTTYYHTYYT